MYLGRAEGLTEHPADKRIQCRRINICEIDKNDTEFGGVGAQGTYFRTGSEIRSLCLKN